MSDDDISIISEGKASTQELDENEGQKENSLLNDSKSDIFSTNYSAPVDTYITHGKS